MKKLMMVTLLITLTTAVYSQNINWRSLREDQKNIVQLTIGYEFGATAQFSYNRSFAWFRPTLLGLDYSFPMGNVLTDDFKVRVGGQMEVIEFGRFSATVRILSSLRRYENTLVRIVSFGSDLALLAGYYVPTWHAGAEVGFDKSIVSHLKHSDVMKANFPGIRDGWYLPTGGNWYYGIQAGKTLGERFDLSLRIGATSAQGHDENAAIPYYLQFGVGMKF